MFAMLAVRLLSVVEIKRTDVDLPQPPADAARISSIMNELVFPIAGAVALLFVILGALKYVTSQGEAGDIQKAKEMIMYALIGLVIVASSFGILQLIIRIGQG